MATDIVQQTWGVSAITLKPAYTSPPSCDELLTNEANTVSLNQFYRAGGVGIARALTECRFAYDSSNLFVVFRCTESNMSFPSIQQTTNWYSMLDAFADQESSFPDKVDLFIRTDMSKPFYYQFIATPDGLKFGCKRSVHSVVLSSEDDANSKSPFPFQKAIVFDANVRKETNAWLVCLRIPWDTIGGKPTNDFGLLPMRTRWRDGEVSSPVAFDFIERPPMDQFIETHFSGKRPVSIYPNVLCPLPSGQLRWQRPALLTYPDAETVRAIWKMQQSLDQPTTKHNFVERLYLTQRWTDLLTLEGFNFRLEHGSIVTNNLTPYLVRRKVNTALQKKNPAAAYQAFDDYLHQLDNVSRDWFADGTPGDIGKWAPISSVESVETNGNVLTLHCLAGTHSVNLHLALPKTGGVRIYGDNEGYFKSDELLPLSLSQLPNSYSVATTNSSVVITQKPFTIAFLDAAGSLITKMGPNALGFRFGTNGEITAVDFRSDLDPDEVIFGFGERYDRFNENGNVLTLWGMDDWFGNNVGLMNETYKPIGLFHSSKGYTVFDNSTYRLRADIGKTNPREYRITQPGSIFDFYIWTGSPERAVASYTDLTGKPILPPKWAFEPWMGRTGRGWNAPSHDAVAEEERVTKRFAELDIPHSAIYSEGPGADSPELNQFMAARNIKVLSWFWPVISESEQAKLLPEMNTNDLPLLNAGNPKASDELGYVDFTNPNALELFRRWWKHRLDVGVAGSMVDFGDRVPEEAVFYNGKRGDEMHNFYAYDYHRTSSETFREKRGDWISSCSAARPRPATSVGSGTLLAIIRPILPGCNRS